MIKLEVIIKLTMVYGLWSMAYSLTHFDLFLNLMHVCFVLQNVALLLELPIALLSVTITAANKGFALLINDDTQ